MTDERGIRVIRGQRVVGLVPLEEYRNFKFHNGDHLEVVAEGLPIAVTYDDCVNVRLETADVLRVPQIWGRCTVGPYRIPTHLVRAAGHDCGNFESAGKDHLGRIKRLMTLEASHDVLEIGCAVGTDALQMMTPRQVASYLGIDVIQDSIVWCTNNLTTADPRFRFEHFDAHHEMYNPLGLKKTTDFAVPCEDSSIDRVIVNAVFTHLFEDEVVHYLREIFRVLRPGGLVYATAHIYSDEVAAIARRSQSVHTFEFKHSDGCYINDPQFPLGSVAYTREALERMVGVARLRIVEGCLSEGRLSDSFDEVAILTKPHHDST